MDRNVRNALIAAALFMLVFGGGLYLMPTIMNAIGAYSPAAAGVFAILFVGAFFGVLWLRGRSQRHGGPD